MSNWYGILKIQEIDHVRNGKVIWHGKNLKNMLHTLGEQFLLKCAFAKGTADTPPNNYYYGLDGRSTLEFADTVASLSGVEPTTGGYARQAISSENGYTFETTGTSPEIYRANSSTISFSATGNYGLTVYNLFMATSAIAGQGVLVASVPLTSGLNLVDGDSVNVRMAVQLHDV